MSTIERIIMWSVIYAVVLIVFVLLIVRRCSTRKKRGQKSKLLIPIVILILFTVLYIPITSANVVFSRSYQKDIIVGVPESEVTLVVEEWQWLMGSGAEIYVKDGWRKTYIGEIGSGDDGYCSFSNGRYEIINLNDGTIKVRSWRIGDRWNEKVFKLPEEYNDDLVKNDN